jgi:hypothetical protein
MNKYSYRRQFLISPVECPALKDWQKAGIGEYTVYVHPDTSLTISRNKLLKDVEMVLIGFIMNPDRPQDSNADIMEEIIKDPSLECIFEKLYHFSGRFVLMIKNNQDYFIFHDACGLRSVYYTKFEDRIFAASQPLLFKLVMPLIERERFHLYTNSNYRKGDIEHWIPSGCTLYENVQHLVPNHYFDFTLYSQKRYWPNRKISRLTLEEGVEQVSELLKKIMIANHARFKLALPLTGGWDSRVILSSCKDIADDMYFYTLSYRTLTESSNDLKIPAKVLAHLGYQHHIIDCRKPVDKDFAQLYESNAYLSHLDDWGQIAYGMQGVYPEDRYVVKGSCTEIGRCAYYMSGIHGTVSVDSLLNIVPRWEQVPFIKEQILKWFAQVNDKNANFGYDVMDLFYMEQRIGSWQAQSQLEWDIVQDSVTPFNNRKILDLLLGVDTKYRSIPDFILFKKIMQKQWPAVLVEPLNPRVFKDSLRLIHRFVLRMIRPKLKL